MLVKKYNTQISTIFITSLSILTLLLLVGIFISTALISLSEALIFIVCVILFIINNTARQQIINIFQLPPIKAGILLIGLIVSFTFISDASYSDSLEYAFKN